MPDYDVIRDLLVQFHWISQMVEATLHGKPIPPTQGQPTTQVKQLMASLLALSEQYRSLQDQVDGYRRKQQALEVTFKNMTAQLGVEKMASSNAALLEANLKRAERRIDDLIITNQALRGHVLDLTKQLMSSRQEFASRESLDKKLVLQESESPGPPIQSSGTGRSVEAPPQKQNGADDRTKDDTQALLFILKTVQLMDTHLPPEEVVKRACQIPLDCFGFQRSAAFLWEEASASFIPVHSLGMKASLIAAFGASRLRGMDLPVLTELLSKGSTLAIENCWKTPTHGKVFTADGRIEPFESPFTFLPKDFVERFEIYSLMAVPFANKGRILGVLLVDYGNNPHEFSETEIAAMNGLGLFIGISLDNIQRQQTTTQRLLKLERQTETESVLSDIEGAIASIDQPEQMIGAVIGMIPRVIACDWVSVLLRDKPAGGFYVMGNLGDLSDLVYGKGTIPFDYLNGAAELQYDRILHRANLETESRTSALDLYLLSHGIRSDVYVPIPVPGEVIGLLHLCSRRVAGFVQEDITLAQAIAKRLGDGLEKTMAQRVRDRRKINGQFKQIESLIDNISKKDFKLGDYRDAMIACGLDVSRRLNLDEEQQGWIKYAIVLHEIGKNVLPEYILNKREKPTAKEMAILRGHPTKGAEMIKNFRFSQLIKGLKFSKFVAPQIRHLYEHWDGTGYPEGLKGETIPIGSRIVSVVNAYAAMTTGRPYRHALSKAEALQEIQDGAGTQFDPRVVAAFLQCQNQNPE
ncbi:MAG TPA: HD domain-containing phosphohydrolase [Nitrospiria bacterium]|nr:HD domain-containing phosphohydrolase [Nitrospiria bacterium]